MKKRKWLLTIIIPAVVYTLLILTVFASCSLYKKHQANQIESLVPEVKSGEFPFKLVYEKNNELITIEDTLIIEFKDIDENWNGGSGPQRIWHWSCANWTTTEDLILYKEFGCKIIFALGSCEYYLGLEEEDWFWKYNDIKPGDIVIESGGEFRTISEEELFEQFDIKIIEKSISPPITQPS